MNILRVLLPKSQVVFLEESSTLRSAMIKMRRHGFTAVPVIDKDGMYVGTVTEGDFLWFLADQPEPDRRALEKHRVKEILKADRMVPANASASVEDIFSKLLSQNFVPVVDDRGAFVGIVTRKTILNMLSSGNRQTGETL